MTADRDALEAARAAGIHALEIPTPFSIGSVNAYLLEGAPLTLVDTGPNLATSMLGLERQLAAAGRRVEELELLLVTHNHVDHAGLTGTLAERSGADVAFLEPGREALEGFDSWASANDDYAADLMLAHGVEPHVVQALRTMAGLVQSFGAAAKVTRPLPPDSRLGLDDRELTVMHRPGHSPWDTLFLDEQRRILIAGDHLLSRVSSNALVTRPLDSAWDGKRPRPLVDYRASLMATRALDVEVVLGGHGPPIVDHRELIDQRLARQEERAERLLELLGGGPMSAHELAVAIWHDVAITQAFLTLSEVLGHLDLLIERGAVRELPGDVHRFEIV